METVTTELVNNLADQAKKFGFSNQVEIEDSSINYFRMLLSRYNSKNGTKIIFRRVHDLYWEVRAPFDRFYDLPDYRPAFDLIQRVLCDGDFKPSEAEFLVIREKLHSIVNLCEKRFLGHQQQATKENGHDVLK